jgi:hypothetical protein
MHHFRRYGLLFTALPAMTLLAISLGHRLGNPVPDQRSLHDWDIPELADHLNRAGLKVRLSSTRINGSIGHNAFLTNTEKDWDQLNRLAIDPHPNQLPAWRGTVYCERVTGKDPADLLRPWGGHCLVVGSFIFYGDAELLERIGAALAPFAPSAAS